MKNKLFYTITTLFSLTIIYGLIFLFSILNKKHKDIAQSIIPGILQVSSFKFILTSLLGLILPSLSLSLIGNGLNDFF